MKYYNKLEELNEKYYAIQFLNEFLEHDMLSNMPTDSNDFREIQLRVLSQLKNDIIKNVSWKEIFNECKNNKNLTNEQRINLEETYSNWLIENSIPDDLNNKLAIVTANTTNIWINVRNNKATIQDILPNLENNFDIVRRIAEHKSKVLNLSPYDCLISKFQPGLKSEEIDEIFNDLKPFLIDLYHKNLNKIDAVELNNNYDLNKKKKIVKKIAKIVGVDLNRARIDGILHPHSYGSAQDVLLGMNYDFDLYLLIYATLHECGHAIYLQNLQNYLQPIGQHRGMAIHESQSIIFEKFIGKNEEFIQYLSKILIDEFGNLPELSTENLMNLNYRVKPNLIRFKSDEITYPLHIILRYEIEKDIINEKIKVKDLPEIWNEKTKEYLGIEAKNHLEGCLQDIHWMKGDIGYFPSYAIGTIISAQLINKIKHDLSNINIDLISGNLSNIKNWLDINIHSKGCMTNFKNLINNATGKNISSEDFKNYLLSKY